MTAASLTARATARRLLGGAAPAALGLASLVALWIAVWARRDGPDQGADRAVHAILGLALPLLLLATSESGLGRSRLDRALRPIWRLGADGRVSALVATLVLSLGAVLEAWVLGAIAILGTRGLSDVALLPDLRATLFVASLAGIAYSCWLVLASTFGRRGGGRLIFVALDWLLGSGDGVLSAPWPRGHVRSLLGGAPVLGQAQSADAAWLLGFAAAALLAALWRTSR